MTITIMGSTKARTSTKIVATTATAMTTGNTRAGTIHATPTPTGMPTTTASNRGAPIRVAATNTCEKYLSPGGSIIGHAAWCSTTIRIGWLPITTWIAAAIGNGTATASMCTTTIITPAGTCSSMLDSGAMSTSNIS